MLNKKWMCEFCERYPGEVGVPFQVTGYPSVIREDDIRILKEAGCFFLQAGIQSLSPENRKNILLRYETNEHLVGLFRPHARANLLSFQEAGNDGIGAKKRYYYRNAQSDPRHDVIPGGTETVIYSAPADRVK